MTTQRTAVQQTTEPAAVQKMSGRLRFPQNKTGTEEAAEREPINRFAWQVPATGKTNTRT